MFFAKTAVNKPVFTAVIILTFVVLGAFSYSDLGVDLFPEVEFPIVTIQTVYPGAGPVEIENLVSREIEEVVGSINGVKDISSMSREGLSLVLVEFVLETDLDIAALDVKEKLSTIRADLPDDVMEPVIMKLDFGSVPIMYLAVSSDRPLNEIYELSDNVVKQQLSKIAGLASIDIVGGREREIRIGVDRERLRAYDLTLDDVVMAIAMENLEIPSGHITEARREISIRVAGEFESVREIEELRLLRPGRDPVYLRDVAVIYDTFEEERERARFNGETCVGLTLVKRPDANIVEVAERVLKELERLETLLPEDIRIDVAQDQSKYISQSIADLLDEMAIGILLTSVLLYLFTHTWQGMVIAAVSMPATVIATFLLMRFAGFTINFMSLMGLAISIGVIVDNSIVVLENIARHREQGDDAAAAAEKGTSEIANAVAATTLTNIVVFTPIAFMSGITGQFFLQFGLAAAFTAVFSLLISFTLTPMLASILLKEREKKRYGMDIAVILLTMFTLLAVGIAMLTQVFTEIMPDSGTAPAMISLVISFAFFLGLGRVWLKADPERRHNNPLMLVGRWLVLLLAIGGVAYILHMLLSHLFSPTTSIIVLTVLAALLFMERKWKSLTGFAVLWERMYTGITTSYRGTLQWTLNHLWSALMIQIAVLATVLFLGKYIGDEFFTQGDFGIFTVNVEMPPGTSLETTDRASKRIDDILRAQPEIESVYMESGLSTPIFQGINSEGIHLGHLMIQLVPREDRDISVFDFMQKIRQELTAIPGADITLIIADAGGGETDLSMEIIGENLDELEVLSQRVTTLLANTNSVIDIATSHKQGVPEIKILPDRIAMVDYGVSTQQLGRVMRASLEGEIASKYREGNEEYDIRVMFDEPYRQLADQARDVRIPSTRGLVPVTDIARFEESVGPVQISRKNKQRLVMVNANVVGRSPGEVVTEVTEAFEAWDLPEGTQIRWGGNIEQQEESFAEMFQALGLAIILTYLVLAAILGSFLHPFIILLSFPLSMIGVNLALIITGKTISLFSLMAIIMLVGIVVNNAILLLDYVQVLRKKGTALREAILEGAGVRLRPIVMANLSTIIGMMPIALELGEGGEMRSPMAIVSIGGIVSATVLTLYIVPVIYYVFESIKAQKA
jgi:hydrophobic/amphiphilic exporter-1 (mainly G- bacteria), HAE1 family